MPSSAKPDLLTPPPRLWAELFLLGACGGLALFFLDAPLGFFYLAPVVAVPLFVIELHRLSRWQGKRVARKRIELAFEMDHWLYEARFENARNRRRLALAIGATVLSVLLVVALTGASLLSLLFPVSGGWWPGLATGAAVCLISLVGALRSGGLRSELLLLARLLSRTDAGVEDAPIPSAHEDDDPGSNIGK